MNETSNLGTTTVTQIGLVVTDIDKSIDAYCKDTAKVVQNLESNGVKMVQQGQYTGGMYTYMDATEKLGLVLELLENFD